MWNAIPRACRLHLVLGVKDLGLGLGFRLGLGSFALICRACTRNILLLAVYLQCALRTVNSVSNCTIYRARVAHGIQRYCVIHHACARRISPCINYIYIYIYITECWTLFQCHFVLHTSLLLLRLGLGLRLGSVLGLGLGLRLGFRVRVRDR